MNDSVWNNSRIARRRFVQAAITGTVGAIAGCSQGRKSQEGTEARPESENDKSQSVNSPESTNSASQEIDTSEYVKEGTFVSQGPWIEISVEDFNGLPGYSEDEVVSNDEVLDQESRDVETMLDYISSNVIGDRSEIETVVISYSDDTG